MHKANLRAADLEMTWLSKADLQGADLSDANLQEAKFGESNLETPPSRARGSIMRTSRMRIWKAARHRPTTGIIAETTPCKKSEVAGRRGSLAPDYDVSVTE